MREGNISQEFRLRKIDETRNYFLEEIKTIIWLVKSEKKSLKDFKLH